MLNVLKSRKGYPSGPASLGLVRKVMSVLGCGCATLWNPPHVQLLCQMSCILQPTRSSCVLRVFHRIRWNSSQATLHPNTRPASPASSSVTKSQKRPHLGINVDPNHGLWAFFRKKEADGVVKHETLEARESLTESGACHLG